MEDLSTPLLDAANAKLSNPSLDCSNMTHVSSAENNEKDQNSSYLYYPLFDGSSSCVNDGSQPSHYSSSDMFDNKEVSAYDNSKLCVACTSLHALCCSIMTITPPGLLRKAFQLDDGVPRH